MRIASVLNLIQILCVSLNMKNKSFSTITNEKNSTKIQVIGHYWSIRHYSFLLLSAIFISIFSRCSLLSNIHILLNPFIWIQQYISNFIQGPLSSTHRIRPLETHVSNVKILTLSFIITIISVTLFRTPVTLYKCHQVSIQLVIHQNRSYSHTQLFW